MFFGDNVTKMFDGVFKRQIKAPTYIIFRLVYSREPSCCPVHVFQKIGT